MRRLLIAVALTALAAGSATAATGARKRATSGTAWVAVTHQEGSRVFVAGDIKDKVLGRGALVYEVEALAGPQPTTVLIKAKRATIDTTKGTLTGAGQALQVLNPDGTTDVRDGTVRRTKGTGAYRGHRLVARFSGPLKDGIYAFSYTGTYR